MFYPLNILNATAFIIIENLPKLKMEVAPPPCPHLHCYLFI